MQKRLFLFLVLIFGALINLKAQKQPDVYPYEDYAMCAVGFKQIGTDSIVIYPTYKSFEHITFKGHHCFVVKLDEKYGLIDNKGKEVLPTEYDGIENEGRYIALYKEEKTSLINDSLETILPFKYKTIYHTAKNYWIAHLDNRIGLLDDSFRIVLPFEYNRIEGFGSLTGYQPGNWGKIKEHKHGYWHWLPEMWLVNKNGKYGVLSVEGKVIIPFEYKKIIYHPIFTQDGKCHSYYRVYKNNEVGVLDEDLNYTRLCKDKYARGYRLEIFPLYCGNEFGINRVMAIFNGRGGQRLADLTDQKVYGKSYAKLMPGCGVVHFFDNGKSGVINTFGREVVKNKATTYIDFKRDYYTKHRNHSPKHNLPNSVNKFSVNYNIGLVTRLGKVIVEPKFTNVHSKFYNGEFYYWAILDTAKENTAKKHITVYNRKGVELNHFTINKRSGQFSWFLDDKVETFVVEVEKDNYQLIGYNGLPINNEKYSGYKHPIFNSDTKKYTGFILKKGNKYGVVNTNGEILEPFVYSDYFSFREYRIKIKDNLSVLINTKDSTDVVYADSFKLMQNISLPRFKRHLPNYKPKYYWGSGNMFAFNRGKVSYVSKDNSFVEFNDSNFYFGNSLLRINNYLINREAEVIIKTKEEIKPFSKGYYYIENNELKMISYKGDLIDVVKNVNRVIDIGKEQLSLIDNEGKHGVYDVKINKQIIPFKHLRVEPVISGDRYKESEYWANLDDFELRNYASWNLIRFNEVVFDTLLDKPIDFGQKSPFSIYSNSNGYGIASSNYKFLTEAIYKDIQYVQYDWNNGRVSENVTGYYVLTNNEIRRFRVPEIDSDRDRRVIANLAPDEKKIYQIFDYEFGLDSNKYSNIYIHKIGNYYIIKENKKLSIIDASDNFKIIEEGIDFEKWTELYKPGGWFYETFNAFWSDNKNSVYHFDAFIYNVDENEKGKMLINALNVWNHIHGNLIRNQAVGKRLRRASRNYTSHASYSNYHSNTKYRFNSSLLVESSNDFYCYKRVMKSSNNRITGFNYVVYSLMNDTIQNVNFYDLFDTTKQFKPLLQEYLIEEVTKRQWYNFNCVNPEAIVKELTRNFVIVGNQICIGKNNTDIYQMIKIESPLILEYLKPEYQFLGKKNPAPK